MITQAIVDQQIKDLGVRKPVLCRAEVKQLPRLMLPGEKIEQLATGIYIGAYALIVATNYRLMVIDKIPGGLVFEDIPYDMVAEVEFVHIPMKSQITIHSRAKKITFMALHTQQIRIVAEHLEHKIMEARFNKSPQMQSPFIANLSQASYSSD